MGHPAQYQLTRFQLQFQLCRQDFNLSGNIIETNRRYAIAYAISLGLLKG